MLLTLSFRLPTPLSALFLTMLLLGWLVRLAFLSVAATSV